MRVLDERDISLSHKFYVSLPDEVEGDEEEEEEEPVRNLL